MEVAIGILLSQTLISRSDLLEILPIGWMGIGYSYDRLGRCCQTRLLQQHHRAAVLFLLYQRA